MGHGHFGIDDGGTLEKGLQLIRAGPCPDSELDDLGDRLAVLALEISQGGEPLVGLGQGQRILSNLFGGVTHRPEQLDDLVGDVLPPLSGGSEPGIHIRDLAQSRNDVAREIDHELGLFEGKTEMGLDGFGVAKPGSGQLGGLVVPRLETGALDLPGLIHDQIQLTLEGHQIAAKALLRLEGGAIGLPTRLVTRFRLSPLLVEDLVDQLEDGSRASEPKLIVLAHDLDQCADP